VGPQVIAPIRPRRCATNWVGLHLRPQKLRAAIDSRPRCFCWDVRRPRARSVKRIRGAGPAASAQRVSPAVAVDEPSETEGEALQQQKSPGAESEPAVPGSLPGPPRFRSPSLPLVLRWRVGLKVRQRIGHFRCQLSLRIKYEHECAFGRNVVEIFPSDACWNIDLGFARSLHRVAIHAQ
jgi:hypothetical protein